ncbi:MAG: helix-turn-helix domain-containing protein [Nostocoides sp.]
MDTTVSPGISADDAARLREGLAQPEAALTVGSETVTMSEPLRQAVLRVVDELGAGHEVVVERVDRFLTTGQAAELLHVSRPTVVKMCHDGVLEFEQPGAHRRISRASVRGFMDAAASRRIAGLAEFAKTEIVADD